MGLFFPLAIVAGYFLGKWVGGWLQLGEWTSIAGAALGVVAAFLNLWRLLKRLESK